MFIHGLESSNQGTKAVFFREKYPDMVIPHFTGPLPQRMEKLHSILSDQREIILVGSSFGGLMASIYAMEKGERVRKLILLAPAIHLMEFTSHQEKRLTLPVWIYHGRQDTVTSLEEVEDVAKKVFEDLRFHAVDDDHYLHKTFRKIPWDQLLS